MSVLTPVIDSYDGEARRIYLKQGVDAFHWIEDIYREYINERSLTEDFRKWGSFMRASGNEPKGGGKYTPRLVTLLDGTRVIPYDENILIVVTGEAITDNADIDPDPFDTTTRTQALKLYITPPSSELVQATEELAAINHMAFNNMVIYDSLGSNVGTLFPAGTSAEPCSVITDAEIVAAREFISTGFILHDLHLASSNPRHGSTIKGSGIGISVVTIDSDASIEDCTFFNAEITGPVQGSSRFFECLLTNISGLSGIMRNCMLSAGNIVLGFGVSHFLDCDSGVPGTGTAIINYNGSGAGAAFRGFKGGTLHTNKTGADKVSIDLLSGQVKIDLLGNFGDNPVNNGQFVVRGEGKVIEATTGEYLYSNTYGNLELINETSQAKSSAEVIWEGIELVKP